MIHKRSFFVLGLLAFSSITPSSSANGLDVLNQSKEAFDTSAPKVRDSSQIGKETVSGTELFPENLKKLFNLKGMPPKFWRKTLASIREIRLYPEDQKQKTINDFHAYLNQQLKIRAGVEAGGKASDILPKELKQNFSAEKLSLWMSKDEAESLLNQWSNKAQVVAHSKKDPLYWRSRVSLARLEKNLKPLEKSKFKEAYQAYLRDQARLILRRNYNEAIDIQNNDWEEPSTLSTFISNQGWSSFVDSHIKVPQSKIPLVNSLLKIYFQLAEETNLAKKGEEFVLVQELLSLGSEQSILFPEDIRKTMEENSIFLKEFADNPAITTRLNRLSKGDVHLVVSSIHDTIALDILKRKSSRRTLKGLLKLSTSWNSNVSQLPDGTFSSTNKSGLSLGSSFLLNYTGRQGTKVKWTANASASVSEYLDSAFNANQYQLLSIGAGPKINIDNSFIQSISPKAQFTGLFLGETDGGTSFGQSIWGLRTGINFKIHTSKNPLSRFIFSALTPSISKTNYRGSSAKNTFGTGLQWIVVNGGKWGKMNVRTNGILSYIDNNANDGTVDYSQYRFDLLHSFFFKPVEITSGISFSNRKYDDYLGLPRTDDLLEFSISAKKDFDWRFSPLIGILKHSKRDSDISAFTYSSTQFLLETSMAF